VCSNYHGFLGWLCDWQTLIGAVVAGLLAILAAVLGGWMAYRAGVRQATATRQTADRQIRALEQQNADEKARWRSQMHLAGGLAQRRDRRERP
jgi:uncharacterized iron-regulated membrane protein